MQTRAQAEELWRAHNAEDSLFRHALAVEAAMRHFAAKLGADVEYWGLVGFLHDIDYGSWPTEHLAHTRELLEPAGYPPEFIRAVLSHGWGLCSDIEPLLPMEKVLYACDELTGFISACALMRPSKSLLDLEVKSVKKKWGAANFAAKVDRSVIQKGADLLGMPLDDLINETILAMRAAAESLGLKGSL